MSRKVAPPSRKNVSKAVEGELFANSARRCCLCAYERNDWTEKRQRLEDRADQLLLRTAPPTGAAKVAERIRKRRRWLFTFLDDPSLEATNNRAERALRPAVIARKLSCGNKTPRGKRTWEILTSLAATCCQRGQDFVGFLRPLLTHASPSAAR